ncbi:MAG: U32 family peptidase [Gammaproteobacteria bacterium]|nr:U32 family peptidase [Gammaproteobacteria bacterium]MDH5592970.1 U32 family peptidase [Gammaproteobacteria bacterium]
MKKHNIELVCPAGSLPALRAAVDNGADAIYIGFRDSTNARNFPGLNFDLNSARKGIDYAHNAGAKVFLALNTYPQPTRWHEWARAIDHGAELGIDVFIIADVGLMQYASERYPAINRHLSVQGSATNYEAINFYYQNFDIKRVVLPRVLSLSQVRHVIEKSPVEIEVFGFGSLCVMVEGRCALSSFVTGESPNTCGACSPAKSVRWEEIGDERRTRLNGVLIDRYSPDENASYPTLCKGRYKVNNDISYVMEEPTSLNVLESLPELVQMGASAIKVEGRQRSPAYVAQVTKILRSAIDDCLASPEAFITAGKWTLQLDKIAEGQTHTLGALERDWQ